MSKFLYLIPFKNGLYFKFGISSNGFSRILLHNRNYEIDYSKSYIIKAESKVIRFLEMELSCTFPGSDDIINKYYGMDGYTEIRDFIYFEEVLNLIKSKSISLNISIEKLILPSPIIKQKKCITNKPKSKKLVPWILIEDNFRKKLLEFEPLFYSVLNKSLIIQKNKSLYNDDIYYEISLNNHDFDFIKLKMIVDFSNGMLTLGLSSMSIKYKSGRIKLNIHFPNRLSHWLIDNDLYCTKKLQFSNAIENRKIEIRLYKLEYYRKRKSIRLSKYRKIDSDTI